jgi:hypothetical protein
VAVATLPEPLHGLRECAIRQVNVGRLTTRQFHGNLLQVDPFRS